MRLTDRERQLVDDFRQLMALRRSLALQAQGQFHRWVRAERSASTRAAAMTAAPVRTRRTRKNPDAS